MAKNQTSEHATTSNDCFIIMPIADSDGYEKGHFTKVYEDIFKPACQTAGFNPIRADEVKQTNLIHLDILQKLIDSPMAICDLSSRNPNVLFELGLRQAFDKPTVLVQEVDTPRIFDIAPLRYAEYRKELRYREVLEDQMMICEAIKATKKATDAGEGVNSIVKILSISKPASLREVDDKDSAGLLQLVRAEMSEMRSDFRRTMHMMERERMFSFEKGSSSRIREARSMLREAEQTFHQKLAPFEVAVELVQKAQKSILRTLELGGPSALISEAKELLAQSEALEHHIITQSL